MTFLLLKRENEAVNLKYTTLVFDLTQPLWTRWMICF